MRIIALEEHFITPMYREHVSGNEFRNFYLTSRGRDMGHDIIAENLDLSQLATFVQPGENQTELALAYQAALRAR